jgi:hypothetical protein
MAFRPGLLLLSRELKETQLKQSSISFATCAAFAD